MSAWSSCVSKRTAGTIKKRPSKTTGPSGLHRMFPELIWCEGGRRMKLYLYIQIKKLFDLYISHFLKIPGIVPGLCDHRYVIGSSYPAGGYTSKHPFLRVQDNLAGLLNLFPFGRKISEKITLAESIPFTFSMINKVASVSQLSEDIQGRENAVYLLPAHIPPSLYFLSVLLLNIPDREDLQPGPNSLHLQEIQA